MKGMELAFSFHPARIGDSLGAIGTNVQRSVEGFKRFIGREEGGWRGEVHGGQRKL